MHKTLHAIINTRRRWGKEEKKKKETEVEKEEGREEGGVKEIEREKAKILQASYTAIIKT